MTDINNSCQSKEDKGSQSHIPFVGRENELAQLAARLTRAGGPAEAIQGRLISIVGAGGVGKTALAVEATKRFGGRFPDGVIGPIRLSDYTPIDFARELAHRLGVIVNEFADEISARQTLTLLLRERQLLLILDNAGDWESLKCMLPEQTASTIIITTRNREISDRLRLETGGYEYEVREICLETFSPPEALTFFQAMLGLYYRQDQDEVYLAIAVNLGFLPIALRQAVSLMLFGPHYTAAKLLEKLEKGNRLDLLRKGFTLEQSDGRTFETVFDLSSPLLSGDLTETMQYLAVCAAGPVPLDFLERLADDPDIGDRLERLFTLSWCERREREETGNERRFYELHHLVREQVRSRFGNKFSNRFVDVVHEIFLDESVHFSVKDRYYPQLEEAYLLAVESKDKRLIEWVYDLYYFLRYRGYLNFFLRLTRSVETLFAADKWALRAAYANRALLLADLGQLDEALALHKKVEFICIELGDRAGLSLSYGNQALILAEKGDLEAALALYKKEEKIKEELGDRAGLSRTYGNQALILAEKGDLEAALALHKKEEAICVETGDMAGLSHSYGNQSLILAEKGDWEAALALHKKEEAICEKLGDRSGLIRSWWNQGLIQAKKNDVPTQIFLWQKAIQLKKEMGMPTKENEEALEKIELPNLR